jgi:hypothetical protein
MIQHPVPDGKKWICRRTSTVPIGIIETGGPESAEDLGGDVDLRRTPLSFRIRMFRCG